MKLEFISSATHCKAGFLKAGVAACGIALFTGLAFHPATAHAANQETLNLPVEKAPRSKRCQAISIIDHEKYDWQDLAAIYAQRWDIELRLRDVKTTLEMDHLRVKTPETARKSLRMALIAYNLIKSSCQEAAHSVGKDLRLMSFKGALDTIVSNTARYLRRQRHVNKIREHSEVFAFIRFDGPATNNHAERALRSLVIFRKVCMGTRSVEGSRNIGIFTSLTQTAKLQRSSVLDLFRELLTGTATKALGLLFSNSS